MAILKNTTISDTGFLQLPVGTTAQRPTPAVGQMRFNTNTGKAEFYNAATAAWVGTAATGVVATGGTVYDTDVEGTTFRVHVFTTTGNSTFAVTRGGPVEYLMAAGGGGGGSYVSGGGGGAGGLLTGTTTVTAQNYTISVGAGGAGGLAQPGTQQGTQGQNSSAFGLTAIGGGFGSRSTSGGSGGSGGGGSLRDRPGGSGTAGQGNAGGSSSPGSSARGAGGGGGGAGSAGATAGFDGGAGGIGIVSTIAGNATFYAGGGSGGGRTDGSAPFPIAGVPGLGGGGQGGDGNPGNNAAGGTPNTGGGGGGGGGINDGNSPAGSGASGIVIIRYPLRQENPVTAAGKTIGDGVVLDLDFAKPTVYAGTGTTVSDSRLNGITGTLSGPTISSLRTHRAEAVYTGAQSITITGSGISVTNTSFSIQWWVRKTLVGQRHIQIGGGSSTNSGDVSAGVSIGTASDVQSFRAQITDGSVNRRITVNPFGFQDSVWTMITYVVNRSNGTAQLYKDATLAANLSLGTFGNSTNSNSMTIHGANGSAKSVVKFYNIPLSADQVQQQYNATRWRFGV